MPTDDEEIAAATVQEVTTVDDAAATATATATVPPTTTNQSQKNTTKTSSSRKRKRKRSANKKPTSLEIQKDKYDKLLYQATKQLTKHAKQVKTFLLQKQIRQCKQQEQQQQNHKDDLELIKSLPLEAVVHQAIRQLGLIHANPDRQQAPSTSVVSTTVSKAQTSWVTKILQHKRFQKAMEEWNDKVTEFRKWKLYYEEQFDLFPTLTPNGSGSGSGGSGKKKKKKKPTNNKSSQGEGLEASHQNSLFCSLDGGVHNNDDDGDKAEQQEDMERNPKLSSYGPAADYTVVDWEGPKKKNRKGQRARRAKAMALAAKRNGKVYESLNWRSANTKNNDDTNKKKKDSNNPPRDSRRSHRQQGAPSQTATTTQAPPTTMSKAEQADAAQHHPSWAAKQQQKTGIVAFQGKKITF